MTDPNREPNRLQKLAQRVPCLGILITLLYSLISTLIKVVVKKIPTMHPIMIVIYRSLITTVFYGFACFRSDYPLTGKCKKEFKLLFWRGFLGCFSFILSYWAMSFLPLADNITILMTSPIYTSILARIFLKEKFGLKELSFALITLTGVIMISRPDFLFRLNTMQAHEKDRLIGIAMALGGATSNAALTIVIRKLKNVPAEHVVFWFGSCCLVFASFFAWMLYLYTENNVLKSKFRAPADLNEYLLLLFNGLGGMTGQALFTMALQVEEAGIISLVRSVDVVNGFVAQGILLQEEKIHYLSVIGSIVVVFALTLAAWSKLRDRRLKANEPEPKSNLVSQDKKAIKSGVDNLAFQAATTLNNMERGDKTLNSQVVSVQMHIRKEPESDQKTL